MSAKQEAAEFQPQQSITDKNNDPEIGWARGDENVSARGATSGRGQQREKNSPIETAN